MLQPILKNRYRMSGFTALSVLAVATGLVYAADTTLDISEEQFEDLHSGAAVSEINGKLEFGYLYTDFKDTDTTNFLGGDAGYVQGAVTAPLGQRFGVQIDAGYLNGAIDRVSPLDNIDVSAFAIGGHLFWRDPSVGLIGIYGHYADYDYGIETDTIDVRNTRVAAEGEAYLGQFTAKAMAGADFLDVESVGQEEYLFLSGELGYYFTDNFRIYGGVDHSFNQTAGTIGAEAMFDTGGISPSVFASASFSNDTTSVQAGFSIYFGSNSKSLIRRHREDDPGVSLFDTGLQSCLEGIGTLNTTSDPRADLDLRAPISQEPVIDLAECNIGETFDAPPADDPYGLAYPYTLTLQ